MNGSKKSRMDRKELSSPRDRYFSSESLTLHYTEWGDPGQDTLVLVHGIRDQCRSWDFFVTKLFEGYGPAHVAALDLRGHGDSAWSMLGRGYQHQDYLRDLGALCRDLGKDSITLVGHSLGASMSVLFAGCFPEKVGNLVLIESVGPFARADDELPKLLAQWLEWERFQEEFFFYSSPKEAARAIQKKFPLIPDASAVHMSRHGTKATDRGLIWKYDPRVRIPSFSTFSEGQVRAFIERIGCPTLVIYGGESDFSKAKRAVRAPLFKRHKVVEISGCGHHVQHEMPGELARVMGDFLRDGSD